MKRHLSISRAWDETRAIFARDGRLFVAVALALIVLPGILVVLTTPESGSGEEQDALSQVLQLIAGLVGILGQLALVRLALGPTTTVGGAIAHGARRFLPLLGALLLLILTVAILILPIIMMSGGAGALNRGAAASPSGAAALAILLVVILVLALSVKFMVAAAVASAEPVGPIAILKRSWALTNGHYWKLLGLLLLLAIAVLVLMLAAGTIGGILARIVTPDLEPFSVGALVLALFAAFVQGVFTVLSSVMLARVYVQLAGEGTAEVETSVPNSGS